MQSGIQYFPLDVQPDEKIRLLEAEYGLKGLAVVVKLWQRIYGGEGYYMPWDKDVALLFARECSVGYSVVSEIVDAAVKRGIFHAGKAKQYGILTSSGIQKRYLEAAKRRKKIFLLAEYLLVDVEPKQENVYIIRKNADTAPLYTDKNEKGKKETKKEVVVDGAARMYTDIFGEAPVPMVEEALDIFAKSLSPALMQYILYLAKADKKPWKWTEVVMDRTAKAGIRTVSEFEESRKRHAGFGADKHNRFLNYTQTAQYDFDAIEKRAEQARLARQKEASDV